MQRGLIEIYTGDGKGKTTAALGLALRAAGHGYAVAFYQFLKGPGTGEQISGPKLGWEMRQFATGRWFIDRAPDQAERDLVWQGYQAALRALAGKDLVVLDEISHVLNLGLLTREEMEALLDQKPPHVELVLTGRAMPSYVLDRADLITEMKAVKHPYGQGAPARQGIEY